MRSYAHFLSVVQQDPDQADDFITKARRIEESYVRRKTWTLPEMKFGCVDGAFVFCERACVYRRMS